MINAVTNSTVPHLTVIIGVVLRRRHLRHVGPGVRQPLHVPVADRQDRGDGAQADRRRHVEVRRGQAARRGTAVRRGGGRQDRRPPSSAVQEKGSLALVASGRGQRRRHHRPARHPHRARHVPLGRAQPRRARAPTATGCSGCERAATVLERAVANRGEIARRVFRTAHAMGLRCVAVYVDADADGALRARGRRGGAPHGRRNYLDGEAIIAAASATGADAIHPGYGFLSENAEFAEAVVAAGLVWVGPPPARRRGHGRQADGQARRGRRRRADAAVVRRSQPTPPRSGSRVLVKAAAGGGGKGMRVVDSAAALADAVAAARREAAGAFGDDRVFLERYVPGRATSRSRSSATPRQPRAPRRTRVLDPATPSEDHRGIAVADRRRPACAAAMGDAALRMAKGDRLLLGAARSSSSSTTRPRVLLPGGEHPAPGRAPRHRGGDRHRPGSRAAARRHGRAARLLAERRALRRPGHRSAPLRRRPGGRVPPATGTLAAFEPAPTPTVPVGQRRRDRLGRRRRLRPDAGQGDRPRARPARRRRRGSRSPSNGSTSPASRRTATSSCRRLRHPAFLAGDTTTDFIERICAPAPVLELTDDDVDAGGDTRRPLAAGPQPGGRHGARPTWRVAGATPGTARAAVKFSRGEARRSTSGTCRRARRQLRRRRHRPRAVSRDRAAGTDRCRGRRAANRRSVQRPAAVCSCRPSGATVEFDVVPRFVVPGADGRWRARSRRCPAWCSTCGRRPATTSRPARRSSCSKP